VGAKTKTPKSPETIERVRVEYLGGQHSLRQIAATHEIGERTIRDWAKKYGWGERKLTERVRKDAHERALRQQATEQASDEEIVAELAARGAQVILGHQQYCRSIQRQAMALQEKLEHSLLDLGERADIFLKLTQAAAKWMPLQRKAENLDDPSQGDGESVQVKVYLPDNGR
jgi:transposase